MQIREAEEKDIPEIVEVLKASLGESKLPLTEKIWRFKHLENPFGKSLVLLAVEAGKIIGVRALMRWQWKKGDDLYNSIRAVDTATHPEHQGKGIFKKLTLAAIEIAREKGDFFVFNTPNEKSRPGYLKMGWIQAGKLSVGITPSFFSFWNVGREIGGYRVINTSSIQAQNDLCLSWNAEREKQGKIYTPKTLEYLTWRYEKNPLQQYEVLNKEDFYLASYVKKRGNLKELRIAECLYLVGSSEGSIKESILEIASRHGVQFISFSPAAFKVKMFSLQGNYGPVLTVKPLNLAPEEQSYFTRTENWAYSLGDLELF